MACVLRGQRAAGLGAGDSLLVLGGGIAGLLYVQLAKVTGAACIVATDLADYRLEVARRLGAEATIRAEENVAERFRELNGGWSGRRACPHIRQ